MLNPSRRVFASEKDAQAFVDALRKKGIPATKWIVKHGEAAQSFYDAHLNPSSVPHAYIRRVENPLGTGTPSFRKERKSPYYHVTAWPSVHAGKYETKVEAVKAAKSAARELKQDIEVYSPSGSFVVPYNG